MACSQSKKITNTGHDVKAKKIMLKEMDEGKGKAGKWPCGEDGFQSCLGSGCRVWEKGRNI